MNWSNVALIFRREVRDQLRDRRTLFMIFVLPVLLYPFIGLSFLQLGQFVRQQATRVKIIGIDQLQGVPPLLNQESNRFDLEYFHNQEDDKDDPQDRKDAERRQELMIVEAAPSGGGDQLAHAEAALREGEYQTVVYFPPDFAERLATFRRQLKSPPADGVSLEMPKPEIYHNTAKDKSNITFNRVERVMREWQQALVEQNLSVVSAPAAAAAPLRWEEKDVAEERFQFAATWSRVFPFMMLIWALTGAFYPAIDLCAGEKERGTLETLLCSPAERAEIVWGKLLTIMLFSIATVVLNLAAIGLTGWFFISQVPQLSGFGPPPPLAFVWLFLAMLPISALFSALCLAVAAFARSNKEGQYYLMPLFLVTLPLVGLPTVMPGFELNLGNSLLPLTGVVLVLKAAIEGDYLTALRFLLPVMIVTAACCMFALRWAVDQFNKESVLFRESERFDLGAWFRHLLRDREDTPPAAAAVMCGLLILLIQFVLSSALQGRNVDLLVGAVIGQIVAILLPAVMMTIFLTRSPRKTLLLSPPIRWSALPTAILLAVVLHPAVFAFGRLVRWMYPLPDGVADHFAKLEFGGSALAVFLVIGLVGPICEEIAFRGFILSGLRHLGRKRMAILISSVFFGLAHGLLQQSVTATVFGVVIGYLAVQSGSLFVAIAYHVIHNSLTLVAGYAMESAEAESFLRGMLGTLESPGWLYAGPAVAASCLAGLAILLWFRKLPYQHTEEERIQEARDREAAQVAAM